MRRIFHITLLLVVLPWLFKSLMSTKKTVSTPPTTQGIKKPQVSTSLPVENQIVTRQSLALEMSGTGNPYSKQPEGNRIEFEVIDGLAIAYGDVLLGKPEPGFQGTHGSYEAPTPRLWNRPEIPFLINPGLPAPKRVEDALDYFRQHTPIRFIPYSGQRDALVFEPGTEHCYSALGRAGGMQPIKLAAGCRSQEVMHEIMHALGFIHEQSRPDRDTYLEIMWQNIQPKYQAQFAIAPDSFAETVRESPFDYHSIMLYESSTFAIREDVSTMRSLGPDPVSPAKNGLSEIDLKRLNRLYNLYE